MTLALKTTESKPRRPAGVARSAQRAATRRDIIRATVRSIERTGFADTTLASVADIAGVAQGSVVFHFKTKDDLLIETLRHLADEYRDTWQRALLDAPADPIEKLCAMTVIDFRRDICTLGKIAVWKSFWAEAKSRPVYQSICGARDEARETAMRGCIAEILTRDGDRRSASDLAVIILSLNDGLMETMLGGPRMLKRLDARRLALSNLQALFSDHASTIRTIAER